MSKRSRLLEDLTRLTALMYSRETLDELTAYLGKVCREVFEVKYAALFFLNEEWEELVGRRPGEEEPIHFPLGAGLAGMVAQESECLLLEDAGSSGIYDEAIDGIPGYQVRDILSAPITTGKGDLVGVIQLADKVKGGFRPVDEDLLTALAERMGEAVLMCRKLESYKAFARSMAASIAGSADAKYAVTVGQAQRVADYAVAIAQAKGLDARECEAIEYAALLHKIGRLAFNREIADLAPAEEEGQNRLFTEAILRGITFPAQLQNVTLIAVHSAEHVDGTGKPDGLTQHEIPLGSRIIAVCDAYDTMYFRGKPGGGRYTVEEILDQLRAGGDTVFDPEIVQLFIDNKIHEREKRRHKRIEYTGRVDVTPLNPDGTDGQGFGTQLLDLSSGGVLFQNDVELPLNTMLKLKIHLVTGVMRAIVRVARVFPNKEKGGLNIGAYFVWNSSRRA